MNGKSSEELERDAEVARANVAETADAIRSKMTPGQLIDEFTGMFSGGDGQAALSTLKAQIRDNPLPLTLVGAGLAWLMLGNGGTQNRASFSKLEKAGFDFLERDREGNDDETSDEGLLGAMGDKASDAVAKAGRVVDAVKERAGQAGTRTANAAARLKGGAGDIAGKTKSAALDIFEQEPLVVAALGMAVGTAVGVLLPHSALEDEHLGSVGTKVRAQAEDLLEKGVAEAKDLAADTYETLKEEADQQGLRSEGSMVDKVGDVLKKTAAKTEDAVKTKLKTDS
jgi:hypothetical protein